MTRPTAAPVPTARGSRGRPQGSGGGGAGDGRAGAYLRSPHVHGDLLTFVADDDVWLAPLEGGRASRLTHDHSPARTPRFSPDGAHVAYLSHRDGTPEVSVVPVDGGAPRRLTWWGAEQALLLGWTADGRVLAASTAGQAQIRDLVVRAVALDGTEEILPWGPAWGVAVRSDGAVALSSVGSRPPAQWKRYRGGTAPRLWLDAKGRGSWEQLLADDPASLVDPMWVGETLVFVSDRAAGFPADTDGQADLWAWEHPERATARRRGTEPRRLTRNTPEQGYVRDASTDGTRVVWHSRGSIWVLDDLEAEPREVPLALPGVGPAPVSVDASSMGAVVPDRRGDSSLVGLRGAVYRLTHRDGPARALFAEQGVRFREPTVLGGTHAVAVSDAPDGDVLHVVPLDRSEEPRSLTVPGLGRVLHLAASPDGASLAVVSHDGVVRVVDVASERARVVGRSDVGEAIGPTFSPDGRYLAWAEPTRAFSAHRLMLADVPAGTEAVALTTGQFDDREPAFTSDGTALAFLSDRTFDPQYGRHEFTLAFSGATRPWLLTLAATQAPPFGPSADGWRISKPEASEAADAGDDAASGAAATPAAAPASPELDPDGAEDRVVPFPVPSGDYRGLRAAKDGILWIAEAGETGALGSRRAFVPGDPTPDRLEYWSFPKRTTTVIAKAVDGYGVSGDGERVVVRVEDGLTVQPATREPEDDDDAEVVSVDTGRLRRQVDQRAEWRQMFEENGRIMAQHFWRADLDGVDWDGVLARYRPLVERLVTHDDLVDLLWETVGELNTSHAYVTPPAPLGEESRRIGLLGADLVPDAAAGGWRIERILPGESSEPDARSPLRAAGVDARPGDVVVAVDGQPVDVATGPAPLLVGAAGKPVELTLRRSDREPRDRRVVVLPLPNEEAVRYQAWVASRRAYVEAATGGRVGYLHVPDMMSHGFAQLFRDLDRATQAEGIVADVRFNRGGHTSQMVLNRLGRRIIAWQQGRHVGTHESYPSHAPRGPVVLVANQFSGSDGDIVNAGAQAMGLGPVVGVRTWGGVVGIDGRFDLVDGTGITQPRYAFWIEGKGWGVENHGVDPDIEVVHAPSDYVADADPQLDRAIAEVLQRLDTTPAATPPPLPAPKVR